MRDDIGLGDDDSDMLFVDGMKVREELEMTDEGVINVVTPTVLRQERPERMIHLFSNAIMTLKPLICSRSLLNSHLKN